jgi:rare lipoprotein A
MQKLVFLAACLFLAIGHTTAAQNVGETEIGKASYYSDDFNGRQTGYGDTYDMNELVGSHKRFPYGSRVRVTRLDNNKSVVVRIIDQGPYVQGRIMDLSRRAAEVLGMIGLKEVDIRAELLEAPGQSAIPAAEQAPTSPAAQQPSSYDQAAARAARADLAETTERAPARPTPPPADRQVATSETSETPTRSTEPETAERPEAAATDRPKATKAAPKSDQALRSGAIKNGLYRVRIEQPAAEGYAVQVASLSSYEGVMRKIAELQKQWFDNILLSVQGTQYKILLGPFEDETTAQRYEKDLLSRYKIKGFTVNLGEIQY